LCFLGDKDVTSLVPERKHNAIKLEKKKEEEVNDYCRYWEFELHEVFKIYS
jgi:hypothetical protein